MQFTFKADPGHAWLEVSLKTLHELAEPIITHITSYSYINKDMVYLEEDCDAYIFLKHLEDTGVAFTIKEDYSEFQLFYSQLQQMETRVDHIGEHAFSSKIWN